MFGVTTSDDYRPVAWMGRYPVDVTTMLVGLHVVCAILTCMLDRNSPGTVGTLNYFSSTAHAFGQGRRCGDFSRTRLYIAHVIGSALVRDRDVHAVRVRSRSGTLYWTARLYCAVSCFAGCARGVANDFGDFGNVRRLPVRRALHFGIFVAFATIYPRTSSCFCGS